MKNFFYRLSELRPTGVKSGERGGQRFRLRLPVQRPGNFLV